MTAVPGLLPSTHGFGFDNDWPAQPAVVLDTPFGRIDIGNAAGGLCGGMVFAVLDYWSAGLPVPQERPAAGEPQFGFLVRRLVDSWHLPAGVARYYHWMTSPDADTGFSAFGRHVVIERGLAWRTVREELPHIAADLDAGQPVALGVVTMASARPADLGENHQVLAYAQQRSGSRVSLRIYDPNQGRRDDITIGFDAANPARAITFEHNLAIAHRVRGFFRTPYAPAAPPGLSPRAD